MSEENKKKTDAVTEEKKVERTPGPRGNIGKATPSQTVRQLWRESHFHRVDAPTKWNPNRKVWEPNAHAPSLKAFVRTLAVTSNAEVAKEWIANKFGAKNEKRSDANEKAQREAATASKAARKKVKSGAKAKDAAPTATKK